MSKADNQDYYAEQQAYRERKMPRLTLRLIDGKLQKPKKEARQKSSPLQPAYERVE